MRFLFKYKNIVINVVLILVIGGLIFLSTNSETIVIEKEVECDETLEINEEEEEVSYVLADVKGMVVNEGVYELKQGSRVIDFINEAGGFKKGADTLNINLSKVVKDADVIYVFDEDFFENDVILEEIIIIEECICPDVTYEKCIDEKDDDEVDKLININTASVDELIKLQGIGEARAKDIIKYREDNPFVTIEDIKNVSGIGDASYNNIKDYITV